MQQKAFQTSTSLCVIWIVCLCSFSLPQFCSHSQSAASHYPLRDIQRFDPGICEELTAEASGGAIWRGTHNRGVHCHLSITLRPSINPQCILYTQISLCLLQFQHPWSDYNYLWHIETLHHPFPLLLSCPPVTRPIVLPHCLPKIDLGALTFLPSCAPSICPHNQPNSTPTVHF